MLLKQFLKGTKAEEKSIMLAMVVAALVMAVLVLTIGKGGQYVGQVFSSFFRSFVSLIKSLSGADYIFR